MLKKCLSVGLMALVVLFCSPDLTVHANDFGVRKPKFRGEDFKTACELVRDADIDWSRNEIMWQGIVDDLGVFHWENTDKKIKKMLKYGKVNIFCTLKCVHELFAPGSGKVDLEYKARWKSAPPAPGYLDEYEDFVRQIVERYDGDGVSDAGFITAGKNVKHWQVETEPGKKPDDQGSHYWEGTAADYADHFLVTYDAIKQADQDATIALAGFHRGSIKYHMNHGDSFVLQVLNVLDQNGGDFDIFDFHFLGGDYAEIRKLDKTVHSILKTYNQFSDKPVWVTEVALNKEDPDPWWTPDEHNAFQAKELVKRFTLFFWRGMEKVFWVKFADQKDAIWNAPMAPGDFEAFRGLTDQYLTPKPAYYTYKLLIEKKSKKTVRKERDMESIDDMWVFRIGGTSEPVYIMWYDSPYYESAEISIPVPWSTSRVTHIITEAGITEPDTEIIPTTLEGNLEITLDDGPVFVEQYF